jgi:pilus assembly protein FimV
MENPVVPVGIGAALLALLGFGIWKVRQRRKVTQVDSSFLESRLQPDSFFGGSGGQRVDTAEGTPTGSSMVYSPSQLDAAGDVDPVAEADVYLAYGRDLQAEEILKEALRTNPQRVAIHTKLLEIYSKRKDLAQFEQVATQAYGVTGGQGAEWTRVCELGQELDPTNPMYQPGGTPSAGGAAIAAGGAAAAAAAFDPMATQKQAAIPEAPASSSVDLDLDFSFDDEPEAGATAPGAPIEDLDATVVPGRTAVPTPPPAAAPAAADAELPALDMDFGGPASAPAPAAPPAEAVRLDAPDLMLSENSLSFDLDAPPPSAPAPAPAPAAAAPEPASDSGMIEFDLGSLSLDGDAPAASPAPVTAAPGASAELPSLDLPPAGSDDPLATKLALAQEFNAIGDADGARSLAQEVIAEASGDLKSRAEKFLAEIG